MIVLKEFRGNMVSIQLQHNQNKLINIKPVENIKLSTQVSVQWTECLKLSAMLIYLHYKITVMHQLAMFLTPT